MGNEKPVSLSREDWNEIYYALDSKAKADHIDDAWKAHLRAIMERIGPDGESAYNGVNPVQ